MRKVNSKEKIYNYKIKIFLCVGFLALFSLLGLYIYQASDFVKYGYKIKQKQENIARILQIGTEISDNSAERFNLSNIEKTARAMGFVMAKKSKYITIQTKHLTKK